MSLRNSFNGSIIKPGFNPLAAQTTTYTYGLFTWGNNSNGQLGLGNTTYRSSPNQVGALTTWSKIAGGGAGGGTHTIAVKTDGTLWTWGMNGSGQLGIGGATSYSSPKQVGALTTWSKIAAGRAYTVSVKTDGTLWTWGDNNVGQLGLGNITNYSSPKQVGALTTWLAISGGGYSHTIAVKTDGTLWTWGRNTEGQLGLGNTTGRSSPVQVGALTTWSTVAAGYAHTIAVKTDGTLWTWGRNDRGQLGLGDTTYKSSPNQVGSLTTWSKVSAGAHHSISVKTDGTLWTWGRNNDGQSGLGNTTYYSSPKQVGALTTWSLVEGSGNDRNLAIKTDGTLWAWGRNGSGQLGLGNTTNYSSPKQVGSLTTWSAIAAGDNHTVSLQY